MSLFDNVLGNRQATQTTLGPAEAFAAIALLATAADGYAADEEVQSIASVLMRMQLFRSYPSEVTRRMFDKLGGILQRQGFDSLLAAAVTTLPHDLHETAFAVATDIALADGSITEEEEYLLNKLYSHLEISEQLAKQIINVMLIKNRG